MTLVTVTIPGNPASTLPASGEMATNIGKWGSGTLRRKQHSGAPEINLLPMLDAVAGFLGKFQKSYGQTYPGQNRPIFECSRTSVRKTSKPIILSGRRDFIYIAKDDEYECPSGERLAYHCTGQDKSKVIHRYWTWACFKCRLKPQCTTGKERRVSR